MQCFNPELPLIRSLLTVHKEQDIDYPVQDYARQCFSWQQTGSRGQLAPAAGTRNIHTVDESHLVRKEIRPNYEIGVT